MAASLKMNIKQIDHLVLTVKDIPTSVDFYESVLGMKRIEFGEGRIALSFGQQKINLHEQGKEFEPKAGNVASGSADLCFIVDTSISDVLIELQNIGVSIIEGPVKRTGALGNIMSVYFRDPDNNLIEISNYLDHIK